MIEDVFNISGFHFWLRLCISKDSKMVKLVAKQQDFKIKCNKPKMQKIYQISDIIDKLMHIQYFLKEIDWRNDVSEITIASFKNL